jgi:hypothetical protein
MGAVARGVLKKVLLSHLRSKRTIRRSERADPNGDGRRQIKDIISISARPAAAEDRAVPGHWEGDLLLGSKNSYVATLVERHTRYVMLAKVANKDTQAVVSARSPRRCRMSYIVPDLGSGYGTCGSSPIYVSDQHPSLSHPKTKGSQQRINPRQAVDRITVQDNLLMSAPGEQRLMQPAPHIERLFGQRTQSGIEVPEAPKRLGLPVYVHETAFAAGQPSRRLLRPATVAASVRQRALP